MRREVRLTWRVFPPKADADDDFAVSKTLTPSLHEKSTFRPWVESMLGRQLTKLEAKHFEVATLLGTACLLEIEHETSARGRVYGKVVSLIAAPRGGEIPDLSED